MDLSKLPKFSSTAPPPPAQPDAPLDYATPRLPDSGLSTADIWFNSIVGLICLYWGGMFFEYWMCHLLGKPFHTNVIWNIGNQAGQEVPYPQLDGHQMITDGGIFFFGLAIWVEVIVKALFARGWKLPTLVIRAALGVAIVSTVFNLYVCFRFIADHTVPLPSGLAAAFGGYIVLDLAVLLRLQRYRRERAVLEIPPQSP